MRSANLWIVGTQMGEIYQGMITPLYEDMTFKTKNGRTCTVQTIER
jgi:hypothetical protein